MNNPTDSRQVTQDSDTSESSPVAGLQAALNLKAERAHAVFEVDPVRGRDEAEAIGREAAKRSLAAPPALNRDPDLLRRFTDGYRKEFQANLRFFSDTKQDNETVIATTKMAEAFSDFGRVSRMHKVLSEVEAVLRLYGYAFVPGADGATFTDREQLSIGRIITDAVTHADKPKVHVNSTRVENIARWTVEEGSDLVWAEYLFGFLASQKIGLIDARVDGRWYPPLDPDAIDEVEMARLADALCAQLGG